MEVPSVLCEPITNSSGQAAVRILIPAYNNAEYLTKCLSSVLAQTYSPIEVFVSDDASPFSLQPIVEQFAREATGWIKVSYTRSITNVGPLPNFVSLLRENAPRDYLIFGPHDDWWIDPDFMKHAVQLIEQNPNIGAVICNSVVEDPSGYCRLQMDYWNESERWKIVNGLTFVQTLLFGQLHPAYSAVILNLNVLNKDWYVSFLEHLLEVAESVGLETDEGFAGIVLAATTGDVAVSSKVVSVRGRPGSSYSSSHRWQRQANVGMFLNLVLLHDFLVQQGSTELAHSLERLLKQYGPTSIHPRLAFWLYQNARWSCREYWVAVVGGAPRRFLRRLKRFLSGARPG